MIFGSFMGPLFKGRMKVPLIIKGKVIYWKYKTIKDQLKNGEKEQVPDVDLVVYTEFFYTSGPRMIKDQYRSIKGLGHKGPDRNGKSSMAL